MNPYFSFLHSQPHSDTFIGVDGLGVISYFTSSVNAGIPGISGSGQSGGMFWVSALVRIDSQDVENTPKPFVDQGDNSPAGNGWSLRVINTNTSLGFVCYRSDGVNISSPTYTVSSSMVGQVIHVVGVNEGSLVKLYVNGEQVGAGTSITSYNYQPNKTLKFGLAHTLGQTGIKGDVSVFGFAGASGQENLPTDAEIIEAYRNSMAIGDIASITNKTQTLISVKKSITRANETDLNVPSLLVDLIGTSSLAKSSGNPTITYAPMPALSVFNGINDSNYWQLSALSGSATMGTSGSNTNAGQFWVGALVQVNNSGAVGSSDKHIVSFGTTGSVNGNGWYLKTTGSNGAFEFGIAENSGLNKNAKSTINQSTLNNIFHVVGVHNGSTIRLYVNGIEKALTNTTGGYRAPTAGHQIGAYTVPNFSASGSIEFIGYAGGNQVPTATEIYNTYKDIVKTVKMQPIAGKTDHLWSAENGFAADLVTGEAMLTVNGNPNLYVNRGATIYNNG